MKKTILVLVIIILLSMEACTFSGIINNQNNIVKPISLPTMTSTNLISLPTHTEVTQKPSTTTPTPKPTPTQHNTRTPRPTFTPTVTIPPLISYGPISYPDFINPLTGFPVSDPQLLERRPIAMKIPNVPRSVRPQFGVSLADHVFEYYLEWGLTRFIAIFYGNDVVKAGPIRSARFFDENIFRMYKSIFVFNGADDQVEKYLLETDYKNLFVVDRDCPPLCRDKYIPGYNNLFGNTKQITEYINKRGVDNSRQDLSGIYFRSYASRTPDYASRIYVKYSMFDYHYWEYDRIQHKYVRYQDTQDASIPANERYKLLTDRLTGLPITADNLVILFVPHSYYLKSSDTEIFQMDLTNSGEAYFFREGYAYRAKWVRTAEDRLLSIELPTGKPAPFKLGNSWFIVINDKSTITKNNDIWRFEFVLPDENGE